ncbi:hypothetical protein [Streptomyces sp. 3214.6]|uniref:hypothetical protein n=1 Tax=Streptomyces sp. 3214.6 TaxID=1882757 RepID=UPI00090C9D84|nr:hypothetical protein [Streptomyces sp. 3214.6]SHI67628.1 hypothetical protein SAMN05444521_8208 [Streptomyces sp. 3214.6]
MTERPDLVEAALHTYLSRQLLARELFAQDPMYHAQLEWLHQMLTAMDEAMEAEHVPTNVRERIVHRTLYGCAPEDEEAIARLASRQQLHLEMAHLASQWPPALPVLDPKEA